MPVNNAAKNYSFTALPFKIALESFKYLGVCVTKHHSDLFRYNFTPLLKRITDDLNRWSILPLSLAGRINCVKMNVLPKFLHLFQYIPVFIPKRFFQSLDTIISRFIWNRNNPRIRKSVLQKPKDMEGLALPNFSFYYWAVNIHTLLNWSSTNTQPPPWLQIEEASCDFSLKSLLGLPLTSSPLKYSTNIVVKNSLKIWTQFKHYFKLQTLSPLSPIHSNPSFLPSVLDSGFKALEDYGIRSFKDLYIDGIFASFSQLVCKFNLPKTYFFKYLQIHNFSQKNFSGFPIMPLSELLDSFFNINPQQKGRISKICNILVSAKKVPWID